MESLGNDMDDLFRKAGDLYPLKTTESDWDGVLGKLREEGIKDLNSTPVVEVSGKRKKRRWLLLLLFIPLTLGSVVYFSSSKKESGNSSSATQSKNNPAAKTGDKHSAGKDQGGNQVSDPDAPAITVSDAITAPAASITSNPNAAPADSKHPEQSFQSFSEDRQRKKINDAKTRSGFINPSATNPQNKTYLQVSVATTSIKEPVPKPITLSVFPFAESVSVNGQPFTSATSFVDPLRKETGVTAKKPKNDKSSSKGIYFGFLAGPDLSAVKFQSVKQPGFSLGILAGYRFNQRFSLETGLLWDRKYYYTKGEYFDKSNTSIPPGEYVKNLNGYCNMFEIPIALRYDFSSNNNHGFFAKAGLSSYLMKKENYDINGVNNGMQVSYPATYYNSTNNFLSIFQLSAGYEHALDGKTKIRIEPYLKIPLRGVGIGNMPISSAGFYIGISHSFR
jgi:hypothetical protein